VSGGTQSGSGGDSAAGGASGLFFGIAALLALSTWFVPRGLRRLRAFERSYAPLPFDLLLERPG
jgi:hypothetical protein